MGLSDWVDPTRCFQLITGVVGIYFSYLVTGILQESMLKKPYTNDYTNAEEKFQWAAGFLIFPCGITWIIGEIINHFEIKKEDRTHIPYKNAMVCGLTVAISTLTYTYAIYLTNFPVVMMFKSCNILSVILVGVLCSRVKDKQLKLGLKKIVVGVLVTLGIIMFKVADPESASKNEQKTEILGIVLLIVSLLADGFLPDFQAEIKSVYKPLPMEMMTIINKWVTIIAFCYSLVLGEIGDIFRFLYQHNRFLLHTLGMGLLSTVGQMFVYRMIKQFKQHFVPFVITTRKIFTVGLSIFYYQHATNPIQIGGLVLVFAIVTYEFVSELVEEKNKSKQVPTKEEHDPLKSTDLSLQVQPEVNSRQLATPSRELSETQLSQKESQQYNKRINRDSTQTPSSQIQ